jgi:phosphoribosylanthranilate isomerase
VEIQGGEKSGPSRRNLTRSPCFNGLGRAAFFNDQSQNSKYQTISRKQIVPTQRWRFRCVDEGARDRYFVGLMPVRVKICGITDLDDARAAIESGADALGFIFFAGSPRYLPPESAAKIIAQLPPFVTKVGVFVDAPVSVVLDIARATGIDTVQLHGSEAPSMCEELGATGLKVIKAFRVKNATSLDELVKYRVSAFLLDSFVPGQLGGTGAKFNWDLAVQAKQFGTQIILAGGLDSENVSDAVSKVAPYAVDVSSGVEISPGNKDIDKVRTFIIRAKQSN